MSYDVRVNSYARQKAPLARTYRIDVPTAAGEQSAHYQDALRIVRRALATTGLSESAVGSIADLSLSLTCGIGSSTPPPTTVTEAVYALIPGPTTYTYTQVGVNPSGTPIIQAIPVQGPPTHEIVGHNTYQAHTKLYRKLLRLRAHSTSASADAPLPLEVWTVEAISEGPDQDFARALPYLAAACTIFLGKNSPGPTMIRLKGTDREVAALRSQP